MDHRATPDDAQGAHDTLAAAGADTVAGGVAGSSAAAAAAVRDLASTRMFLLFVSAVPLASSRLAIPLSGAPCTKPRERNGLAAD